jgi:hypothetical protein
VSNTPDGPEYESVAEPVTQAGRPPVPPRPVPSGAATAEEETAGQHRTERVPFPLPPPAQQDEPAHDPETGQLDLGGYPPRVPGAGRPRRTADPEGPDATDGGGRHGR